VLQLCYGVLLIVMLLWLVGGALKLKLKFYALTIEFTKNRRGCVPKSQTFFRAAAKHQPIPACSGAAPVREVGAARGRL
jgi:hypothetical protein